MDKGIKAVGLVSGGLDSALAMRLVQEQGIEVIGISCRHPFHNAPPPGELSFPERAAKELGIELVRPDVTDTLLAILKDPPHGFGRYLNPCIDCRIIYLQEGAKLMEERGASFLITGEVLGQRPMSQRRDAMNAIDRDSGLRGLVLRPLCARLLNPTIAEEKGWVDRDKLLGVSGRGRKEQIALADRFGLTEYSSPAGGCLLTMEDFARKMEDLIQHSEELSRDDVELIKAGRHFRLSLQARLVVGKNDPDNHRILSLVKDNDLVIMARDVPGPVGLVRGEVSDSELDRACAIVGRYVKRISGPINFIVKRGHQDSEQSIEAAPLGRTKVDDFRI